MIVRILKYKESMLMSIYRNLKADAVFFGL